MNSVFLGLYNYCKFFPFNPSIWKIYGLVPIQCPTKTKFPKRFYPPRKQNLNPGQNSSFFEDFKNILIFYNLVSTLFKRWVGWEYVENPSIFPIRLYKLLWFKIFCKTERNFSQSDNWILFSKLISTVA